MSADAQNAAEAIDRVISPLVEWTLSRLAPTEAAGGPSRSEIAGRIRHLAESIGVERSEVLIESVRWTRSAEPEALPRIREQLVALRETVQDHLPPPVSKLAASHVDAALADLDRAPAPTPDHDLPSLDPLALQYLEALLDRRSRDGAALVTQAADAGRDIRDIFLNVLAPAQVAVGDMWHRGEISVADEHLATETTSTLVAVLGARAVSAGGAPPREKSILLAAVGGDLHDIGVRLVSRFFELAGWSVTSLGANTPVADILALAEAEKFDVIGLASNSMLTLRPIRTLITAIRERPGLGATAVVVGGFPFARIPDLWRSVGADAGAADARDAVALAEQLVDRRGPA